MFKNCHKLSFICGFYNGVMSQSIAVLVLSVLDSDGPHHKPSAVPFQVLCILHTRLYLG